jgi:ADP-glucose pyrophosphorylase
VRTSVIASNVIVETASYVEGSVLMPGVRIGRNAVVRNAILDKNREKIIMQKLAKALASSRLVRKKAEPEEDK